METMRKYLAPGVTLQLETAEGKGAGDYTIVRLEGQGGASLCYRASCGNKTGRLKEFFPCEVPPVFQRDRDGLLRAVSVEAKQRCREFCRAYEILEQCKANDAGAELLNNFIPPYQLLRGGDTVYVWTPDDKQGISFERYLQDAWKKPSHAPEHKLYNILNTILTLTDCIRILHRAQLLHLDIKPENFLVLYDGDFNINPANISLFDINSLCAADSAYHVLSGTAGYFAPEIPRGRADNRSDLYSIGAMLFRAVLDSKYRKEQYAMLDQLLAASPLLLASHSNENVFLRHILGRILKKTLAVRPGDRYGSCEELMEALEQAITLLLPDVAADKLGQQKRLAILDTEPQEDCDPETVIRDLLFRYPLDKGLQPDERQIRVLVAGAGTYGQKFMDICLQAGQMLGRELQITALSQQPELDREVYLQIRPALPEFVDCGTGCADAYAVLQFRHLEFGKETAKEELQKLMRGKKAHCVFVSLGDDARNRETALLLAQWGIGEDIHYVTRSRETAPDNGVNPVDIRAPILAKGIHPQLEQMALRTHLVWRNGAETDMRAARRQFRKKYNLRASIAYALSVSSKLRSVGICEENPQKAAEEFCRRILSVPGEQYRQLVALEHRRWVLEKVTSGWRLERDLESGIARGSMRDGERKTHPCILPSTAETPLKCYTRGQWDTPGPWDEALDPLDQLSVTQHRLCMGAAHRLRISRPLQMGEPAMIRRRLQQGPAPVKAALEGYLLCLTRILQGSSDAVDALDRYETALQQAFSMLPPMQRRELNGRLRQVRVDFFPAIEACLYRDYKAQDERMICCIPYILDHKNHKESFRRLSEPVRILPTHDAYQPVPLDTEGVMLPPELLALTEQLAENIHDVWAAGRLRDGWTYGESLDDAAMTHPCLVPYGQLPDSEKEYDRHTAMQTLKYIAKLGYQILPPEEV